MDLGIFETPNQQALYQALKLVKTLIFNGHSNLFKLIMQWFDVYINFVMQHFECGLLVWFGLVWFQTTRPCICRVQNNRKLRDVS